MKWCWDKWKFLFPEFVFCILVFTRDGRKIMSWYLKSMCNNNIYDDKSHIESAAVSRAGDLALVEGVPLHQLL